MSQGIDSEISARYRCILHIHIQRQSQSCQTLPPYLPAADNPTSESYPGAHNEYRTFSRILGLHSQYPSKRYFHRNKNLEAKHDTSPSSPELSYPQDDIPIYKPLLQGLLLRLMHYHQTAHTRGYSRLRLPSVDLPSRRLLMYSHIPCTALTIPQQWESVLPSHTSFFPFSPSVFSYHLSVHCKSFNASR